MVKGQKRRQIQAAYFSMGEVKNLSIDNQLLMIFNLNLECWSLLGIAFTIIGISGTCHILIPLVDCVQKVCKHLHGFLLAPSQYAQIVP